MVRYLGSWRECIHVWVRSTDDTYTFNLALPLLKTTWDTCGKDTLFNYSQIDALPMFITRDGDFPPNSAKKSPICCPARQTFNSKTR